MIPADLHEIARIYRSAVDAGRPPVQAVTVALGRPRSTAARYVALARAAGHLPPAESSSPQAYRGDHKPKRTRWLDGSESWLACRTCRTPWPCSDAEP